AAIGGGTSPLYAHARGSVGGAGTGYRAAEVRRSGGHLSPDRSGPGGNGAPDCVVAGTGEVVSLEVGHAEALGGQSAGAGKDENAPAGAAAEAHRTSEPVRAFVPAGAGSGTTDCGNPGGELGGRADAGSR